MRRILAKPHLIIVSALMTIVLGSYAYTRIPADLLPQFDTPAVQIVCFYPGMPPEVMEKDIMSRLQRWTAQSVGIEHQEAKAMQGVCVVKDFFTEGISNAEAMAQVSSYAMSDMFYLPPGTIPPMVMPFDPTASVPLCLVVVSNPEMNEQELYDIAYYELRNKLQSISGVIAPAVYGGKLRRILAYVEADKLEAYGLTLMDVQASLRKQNVLIPAGSIKIGRQDLQIFTNAIPEKIEELNSTPIRVIDGVPVLMSDVGEVKNASQIQSNIVRINGSRQVYIPIYRQPGANTIEIVDRINKQLSTILVRLKNERAEDPKMKSLVLSVAMDQSVGVRSSIKSLQLAGALGALLAGLVVLVFLRNFRLTAIVLVAIPIAIIAAFLVMFFTGDSINAMTLGGLALAIGILVDQSIVVLENIVRHAHMGKSPMDAAADGTAEVLGPILVSTLTFAVVFLPVIFLSGLTRFLFAPLAISAVVAIFASFLLSITLVPAYCAYLLPKQEIKDENDADQNGGWFGSLLRKAIAARLLVVGASVAAFFIAVLVTMRQGQELFPSVDSGQITMYVRLASGTRIEETEKVLKEIEATIIEQIGEPDPAYALDPNSQEHPDSALQLLISNIGVLMDWPAAYTPNTGPMDAFMLLQLKDRASTRDADSYVIDLRKTLAKKFPDVEISYDTGGMLTAALNMGEPAPIHFQVQCSDLEKAQRIATIIRDTADKVPGATDVRIAQRIDYPALEVEMDRELAARMQITPQDVMTNLVAATNSTINFEPTFWIDKNKGNHYFFGVQYREEDLNSEKTIRDIPVMGGDHAMRRLGSVAKIKHTEGPAVVHHRNISRVTDVYAGVLPGYDVGRVVTEIERRLEANDRLGVTLSTDDRGPIANLGAEDFAGTSYRMMGEVKLMRDSFSQLTIGLIIATLLVYLVMVVQFRSFTDPLIVLLSVPLAYVGVALLLFVTNTHLSVPALMGIVMMIGIVVEYSIVLVDFANRRMGEGKSPTDAVIDAARIRLRPILMTSLTTWLALLPMAIGFGGSGTNAPLARAIIGGVIGATVLSLIVVPCLYVLMKRNPDATTDASNVPTAT
ncbi:MAG: efflux RND transporter permease subunit [Rubripirellula sp.]|nr:efflux RND transporter permease subunit [Rubripirellula sp.]